MSFSNCLYQLFIGPLELLFEISYALAKMFFHNSGIAIIFLSLAVNILVLPLYKRADAIQAEERELEKRMEHWVSHIKRTFHGDERFMMLQSYYRLNDYKPYYSLKATLPLLLQVPFFIAAYRFLSELQELRGMPFGPILDMGAPDGLLVIAGLSINLLPILMTLINIVSSAIYTKGFSMKEKLQLYGMALLFLVLLYNSPAGLVFYWTLNNVFSLGKNILQKVRLPGKLIDAGMLLAGFLVLLYALAFSDHSLKVRAVLGLMGLLLCLPLLLHRFPGLFGRLKKKGSAPVKPAHGLFFAGGIFLALLTGLLIPSSVVAVSPAEFVLTTDYQSPLFLLLNSLLLATGTFVMWFGLFYFLADNRMKGLFSLGMWLLSGMAIVNYMFFGTNLGMLTPALGFEVQPLFSAAEKLINLAVLALLALLMLLLWQKKNKLVKPAYVLLCLAVLGMGGMNVITVQREEPAIRQRVEAISDEKAHFTLSKEGKNVVVLMVDRAINAYLPYIFDEAPQIAEKFEGFTYYPNTISYGKSTIFAAPSLFGGYEYTPEEMNKRDTETLESKHNEALRVMPVLFDEAGYDVTVIEPPYAGYDWIADLSIYDEYPRINTFLAETGQFNVLNDELSANMLEVWHRNFFCYSVMKASPLALQMSIYQQGTYLDPNRQSGESGGTTELSLTGSQFINTYSAMNALPEMTQISEDGSSNFLMMSNAITHYPVVTRLPEYDPFGNLNEPEYYREYAKRYNIDGKILRMDDDQQMGHYHANYIAMRSLGQWFDYLRENDVYDNTRIIIVGDHGYWLNQMDSLIFGSNEFEDAMTYNPLMLVKDFDSHEFKTDMSFMTNADVPTIAMGDVIEKPVNPFTGKPINNKAKAGEQHILCSEIWETSDNTGNTFAPERWYAVSENIFDLDNWKFLGVY